MQLSILTSALLLAAIELGQLGGVFPYLSSINFNVQLPPILCSVVLTTGISAIILYLLSLALVATHLFLGFWCSLEEEY